MIICQTLLQESFEDDIMRRTRREIKDNSNVPLLLLVFDRKRMYFFIILLKYSIVFTVSNPRVNCTITVIINFAVYCFAFSFALVPKGLHFLALSFLLLVEVATHFSTAVPKILYAFEYRMSYLNKPRG
jgi:hypothetical protein